MSSEIASQRRRSEVYNGLKISIETLVNVVQISLVPGLEGIVTTVKSIMDIIEVKLGLVLL
jgi:hypothetical protein